MKREIRHCTNTLFVARVEFIEFHFRLEGVDKVGETFFSLSLSLHFSVIVVAAGKLAG